MRQSGSLFGRFGFLSILLVPASAGVLVALADTATVAYHFPGGAPIKLAFAG